MPIDAWASAPQYFAHIAPVFNALPKTRRGIFYVPEDLIGVAKTYGIDASPGGLPREPERPVIVSASGNMGHARIRGRRHIALMEHGCGLSYGGDHGFSGQVAARSSSYAGGDGRGAASLFLHPGPHPAARDTERYPDARVVIVGSPALDDLPRREYRQHDLPTVAFSFHWDTNISPETRSAFIYYREHLAKLAQEARRSRQFRVIGHGHPRIIDRLEPWYRRKGIEVVRDFRDVCRRADLYAVDNSSTLYEFASTGRPVVVLNAPFYRRHVEHGLRFWDAADVGVQVDESYDIGRVIPEVLLNGDRHAVRREAALDLVYGYRSGAAQRAARVLSEWDRSLTS